MPYSLRFLSRSDDEVLFWSESELLEVVLDFAVVPDDLSEDDFLEEALAFVEEDFDVLPLVLLLVLLFGVELELPLVLPVLPVAELPVMLLLSLPEEVFLVFDDEVELVPLLIFVLWSEVWFFSFSFIVLISLFYRIN